jgi:hypothetical protein
MNALMCITLLVLALASVNAFTPSHSMLNRALSTSTRLQMAEVEIVFPNKKKVKAESGSLLKDACKKAGFKPNYG